MILRFESYRSPTFNPAQKEDFDDCPIITRSLIFSGRSAQWLLSGDRRSVPFGENRLLSLGGRRESSLYNGSDARAIRPVVGVRESRQWRRPGRNLRTGTTKATTASPALPKRPSAAGSFGLPPGRFSPRYYPWLRLHDTPHRCKTSTRLWGVTKRSPRALVDWEI